jgi:hypothetical protein
MESLVENADQERDYTIGYKWPITRLWLRGLFYGAVQAEDRENKTLTVRLDKQAVRGMRYAGYDFRDAGNSPSPQPPI